MPADRTTAYANSLKIYRQRVQNHYFHRRSPSLVILMPFAIILNARCGSFLFSHSWLSMLFHFIPDIVVLLKQNS